MPVRLGFPVGVKGIVQLVQGPQYAAGVGLVRYGAKKLEDLDSFSHEMSYVHPIAQRAASGDRRGFWGWLREAF
jgi:cell division protein FtsA